MVTMSIRDGERTMAIRRNGHYKFPGNLDEQFLTAPQSDKHLHRK